MTATTTRARTGRADELQQLLFRLDRRPFGSYRDVEGSWDIGGFILFIDHAQPDPFAPPTRVRLRAPHALAGFPSDLFATRTRSIAVTDFLARAFAHQASLSRVKRGKSRYGAIEMDVPGQEILERTSVVVTQQGVEARFTVQLPARNRSILGRDAAALLLEDVRAVAERALLYANVERAALARQIRAAEAAESIRARLADRGLVAFVANKSILPRRSGVDPRPLRVGARMFQAPDSLAVTFDLPDGTEVSGLGIPRGVTVIAGGGFHGKSTLLDALARGVYNHMAGDGRELVVTEHSAVTVRAEDGRSVAGVDISAFVRSLPGEIDPARFTSANASGSTSQAAAIAEAVEVGATTLLLDEDTCAANFMFRDRRMQELVDDVHEPITPFVDSARALFDRLGVSTILVMGGSGEYLDVADTVIRMTEFVPDDATSRALEIVAAFPSTRRARAPGALAAPRARVPAPESVDPRRGRSAKVAARGQRAIAWGEGEISVAALDQIVDAAQVRALAQALVYSTRTVLDGSHTIEQIVDDVEREITSHGLAVIDDRFSGSYAAFRRFELAAALNRLRTLRVI